MGRLKTLPPMLSRLPPATSYVDAPARPHEDSRGIFAPWRKWYNTTRWRKLRLRVLARDLYTCQMCKRIESNTASLVADHRRPHRGDEALFWDEGNLWALCAECHSSAKQKMERAGRI